MKRAGLPRVRMTTKMAPFTFVSRSEADTSRLASALAGVVPDGTTITLSGTLGAGKTRFVQAFAKASGVAEGVVTSPTYVLCQEYNGKRTIYHFDAYRIADEDEFWQLGVDEYFQSDGVVFVEWGERVSRVLPDSRLELDFDVTSNSIRTITLRATRADLQEVVRSVTAVLERL